MTLPLNRKAEPFYLDGPNGRLFAIHHPPHNAANAKGCFLYIQPLGEEMNRCRQMASMQARAFAQAGYGCLLLDLIGTGDSAGEYPDGDWDRYQADLNAGVQWLNAQGYPHITLWAVRHGALLALDLARSLPEPRRLLLWQPVFNGKSAVTQILRIALAGTLEGENKPSMGDLRQTMATQPSIELSGYDTSCTLLATLETQQVANYYDIKDIEVCWFDVLASQEQQRTKESSRVEENWRNAGATIDYQNVIGPAFWQVWERVVANELLERTVDRAQHAQQEQE